jgi:hypothetical protein
MKIESLKNPRPVAQLLKGPVNHAAFVEHW